MLRNFMQMVGAPVVAMNGEVGEIRDIYFDDDRRTARYLVVETDGWLTGRQVLISPHVVRGFAPDGKQVRVDLNYEAIQVSPAADMHKPVSRQYEGGSSPDPEYAPYWLYGSIWSTDALAYQGGAVLAHSMSSAPSSPEPTPPPLKDLHLRSCRALVGYAVHAEDAVLGHVTDLVFEEETWALCCWVIDVGRWPPARSVRVCCKRVRDVNWVERTVTVEASLQELVNARMSESGGSSDGASGCRAQAETAD
ncbi:MAG TPA: PRC-barrel domain-containing protein [Steroidobacteraceae bacterium]|jgi:uncharacterized protein YrrD